MQLFDNFAEGTCNDHRELTNWSIAQNVRATSCFSCPLTTSVKDMVFSPSFSTDNFSKSFSPYVCMSKGGSASYHLKVIHYLIESNINVQKTQQYQSSADAEIASGVTCSSKLCSIRSFHVDTRTAISFCSSISLRFGTRESWKNNDVITLNKEIYGSITHFI